MALRRRTRCARTTCRRCACWARPASRGTRSRWWWFFDDVGGGRLPLINYSGGTEVSGGIVCVQPDDADQADARSAARASGTAADVIDADGQPVRGAVGELAIRQPLPGMTRGFWQDRERYLETYWSRVPGHVGPRRLGARRRRRLLVHPGPLRRHAQGRRQARRPGRGRERGGRATRPCSRPRRSACRTRSRARSSSSSCGCGRARRTTPTCAQSIVGQGRRADGQGAQARGRPRRQRTCHDTQSGKIMRRVARAAYLGSDPGDLSALENPLAVEAIRGAALGA